LAHKDIGREIINRFISDVDDIGVVELRPRFEGRLIITVIAPKIK